jgi:hypothetical protein
MLFLSMDFPMRHSGKMARHFIIIATAKKAVLLPGEMWL